MNFFRDLLGSGKAQNAETSQLPSYPQAPAYPSSSPPKYPASNSAKRGTADEDQWSVDAAEKPVSAACRTRPGATVGAVGSKTQQQRRDEEAAERAREEAELAAWQRQEEERIRQEEEDAKHAHSRVQLAMYDLSGGLVQYVPAALLSGAKFDGIWHTGVRIFDKEYWFGGGIFENEIGDSPFGAPVRVERLGISDRTHEELLEFIRDEVLHSYNPKTYHFLNRNCNHFSSEVVQFLLAGRHAQGPLEEVLEQPKWCYNHSLAQLLIPAMNKWLGGFGADDSLGRPQVKHMTRAEKEQEQRRVKAQWADWVQEKNRLWQEQLEERRREDEADEFQNWMLDQHQRMESEEKEAKKRAERDAEKQRQARQLEELWKAQQQYDEEERYAQKQRKAQEEKMRGQQQVGAEEQSMRQQPVQQSTQRQREVEQTLREILDATKQGADAAVLEWALAEAKEAGLQSSAPFLIRDAEYVLRERT